MAPVVDRLAGQFADSVKFVRVNIDASPQSAAKYGIRNVPTFAVFKNGELVGSATGAMPAQQLSSTIENAIGR